MDLKEADPGGSAFFFAPVISELVDSFATAMQMAVRNFAGSPGLVAPHCAEGLILRVECNILAQSLHSRHCRSGKTVVMGQTRRSENTMFNTDSDREWEKYGRDDPYFGVITDNRFHRENLTPELKAEFFHSGHCYIEDVLAKIRRHLAADFTITRALDFGCGVGRLVIPLAGLAKRVTGVDVSDSMLAEARRNCRARDIDNVTLVKSDDSLSRVEGEYDFIHSIIVFQHIPVARGERIFSHLLSHLQPGGVAVVHFTYAKKYALRKWFAFAKGYIPGATSLFNLVQGRRMGTPQMQMNAYHLNPLLQAIQNTAADACYLEFTNHGGELGVILYFRKPAAGAGH